MVVGFDGESVGRDRLRLAQEEEARAREAANRGHFWWVSHFNPFNNSVPVERNADEIVSSVAANATAAEEDAHFSDGELWYSAQDGNSRHKNIKD